MSKPIGTVRIGPQTIKGFKGKNKHIALGPEIGWHPLLLLPDT